MGLAVIDAHDLNLRLPKRSPTLFLLLLQMSIDTPSLNHIRLSVIGPVRIETPDTEPVKLPRRAYQVLAGLALAPEHKMLRTDITKIVWPLSEPKSQDVLLHQTRRAIVDALQIYISEPPVVFFDRVITLDVTYIDIDIVQASLLARRVLESNDLTSIIDLTTRFDGLAGSAVLLADFPGTFDAERCAFNDLRHSVLLAGWAAAVQLGDVTREAAFEHRLRNTGYTAQLSKTTLAHSAEANSAKRLVQSPVFTPDDKDKKVAKPWRGGKIVIATLLSFGLITAILSMRFLRSEPVHKQSPHTFFTYSNYGPTISKAIGVWVLPGADIAVLTSKTVSNAPARYFLHRVSPNGSLRWSTPLELSGFDRATSYTISGDTTGNLFVMGKVFVSQSGLVSPTPGWHPIVMRIASDGTISRSVIIPYPYRGEGSDFVCVPDNTGGIWVSMLISHNKRGPSTALCHIEKNGSLVSMSVMHNPKAHVSKLFTSPDGSVIMIGSAGSDGTGRQTGILITKLGLMGRTLWSTPINGTLDQVMRAVQYRDDLISMVVKHPRSSSDDNPVGKASLIMIKAKTGKIDNKITLDDPDETEHFYLATSDRSNDYVIASTSSTSNDIGFIFADSASNEATLKISANIANTSHINGISYLSSAGSRTFRALVNVTMSGKANQKATFYVHKDRARDIEMSSLSDLGEIPPMNIDKGVAAINTGNTFKLMRLDDIR